MNQEGFRFDCEDSTYRERKTLFACHSRYEPEHQARTVFKLNDSDWTDMDFYLVGPACTAGFFVMKVRSIRVGGRTISNKSHVSRSSTVIRVNHPRSVIQLYSSRHTVGTGCPPTGILHVG